MSYHTPTSKMLMFVALYFSILGFSTPAFAQPSTPVVTVRFANPSFNCLTLQYCLDVEFLADTAGVQVFGMNVRFFFPDSTLQLVGFSDFQGGYGPVAPDPPTVLTSASAGPALFNFVGPASFVNGANSIDWPTILVASLCWSGG